MHSKHRLIHNNKDITKHNNRDFRGGPAAKTLHSQYRGLGSILVRELDPTSSNSKFKCHN